MVAQTPLFRGIYIVHFYVCLLILYSVLYYNTKLKPLYTGFYILLDFKDV